MKKRLTDAEFHEAIKGLDVGSQTLEIARGVLINGTPQKEFAASLGLSKGAISQAVNRVWAAHEEKSLPDGYVLVSAVLPEYRAFIVKKWAEDATKKRQHKK
ncbi:MAG TPA: transcriptional regulator KorA [Anaerolineae bacterium]|nr:transcriptional regulator KorA [Anaerolineae bacterium]